MNSLIWFPRAYDEKHAQLGVVHGVVHGPGPQVWSMDLGPCFVYVLFHAMKIKDNPLMHMVIE